jgi:hypothetical protein
VIEKNDPIQSDPLRKGLDREAFNTTKPQERGLLVAGQDNPEQSNPLRNGLGREAFNTTKLREREPPVADDQKVAGKQTMTGEVLQPVTGMLSRLIELTRQTANEPVKGEKPETGATTKQWQIFIGLTASRQRVFSGKDSRETLDKIIVG